MARERKFRLKFQSDSGVFYQINIFDNDGLTDVLYEPNLGVNGFELTYQNKDQDRFTGLIPSECQFEIYIEGDAQQQEINKIKAAEYGRYQMEIQRSETTDTTGEYSLYWCGNLLNDISPEEDVAYPKKFTLTAICGLAALQDVQFDDGVGYSTPSSYQTLQYFGYALRLQVDTTVFWGDSDPYISTYVDWTTPNMTHAANRDPLVYSRFNFMAFVELGENGTKTYSSAFDLLNGICKAFGMRCFLADGKWNIIQINYYDNWTTGNTHFYRNYYKANTLQGVPNESGSVSGVISEGTNIKRLANGDFDYLAVLKEVVAEYDKINAFNIPFISYDNNSGSTYPYAFNFNEIPIWNGYRYSNFQYSGGNYAFNNSANNLLTINLGEVVAQTGATLSFKRRFNYGLIDGNEFTPYSSTNIYEYSQNQSKVVITGRFKLVGASETKYARIYPGGEQWVDNDNYFVTGATFQSYLFNQNGLVNEITMTGDTAEIPFDGQLYAEFYATVEYSLQGWTSTIVTPTTPTADNLLIFSAPSYDNTEGINYNVDGTTSAVQIYKAKNSPSGTPLLTGDIYDVGKLYIGSGGTGVGNLETFNLTTLTWEVNPQGFRAFNSGSYVPLTKLLVQEILDGQQAGAGVYNGSLKITDKTKFTYLDGITISGSNYMPSQCTFNANSDTWNGDYYALNLSGETQVITVGVYTGNQSNVGNTPTNWTGILN